MEDRETPRMRKYGESKTTRIMMATVPHVTSGLGLRKFQVDGFSLTRVYSFLATSDPAVFFFCREGLLSHIYATETIICVSALVGIYLLKSKWGHW